MAAGVIGATVLAIALVDGWLAVVGLAVLSWAVSDVLLPASASLDDEGVLVRRLGLGRRHPWSRFRAFRPHRDGFVLLGRGHRPALRRARTVLLCCDDPVRETIDTALATRLPRVDAP